MSLLYNKIEHCYAAHIVHGCQQYLSIIGRGRAKYCDLSVADAEGRGKKLICETLTNHDILQEPSSIIVLSFTYTALFYVFCIFFLQVSKTTYLPKVQQSGHHCMFTKIEGNAHAQSIICSEQRF